MRAGVLEHPTVELLRRLGLAERLDREGLSHRGIELAFEGRRHRIDFLELTGRSITVYGQQEVVKDLIAARLAAGGEIVFEALDVTPDRHRRPTARSCATSHDGERHELRCRIVAGCDGFHGVCRDARRRGVARWPSGTYPFGWLGILAEAAPTIDELIYANHDRGFALYSMRSPTVTRLYLQVPADERIEDWPDDRIWAELAHPPADRRRLHAQHRPDPREGHHGDAQLRRPRRCATATCCSPATPPTSCRPPAPRG